MKHILTCLIVISILILPIVSKESTDDIKKQPSFTTFDKQYINDRIMTIDYGSHRSRLDQHIYQVREGSIGGYDSVGGSCGCN